MFAGEGTPERTNRRFHFVARASPPTASRRPSTRSRSTARTRPCVPTSMARSATPRVDRDRRRHQEALFRLRPLRSLDSVSMTINGRADDPRVLHECRDRPAGREAPEGDRGSGRGRSARSRRTSPAASARATRVRCPKATTASASGCWGFPATRSWMRDLRPHPPGDARARARHRAG